MDEIDEDEVTLVDPDAEWWAYSDDLFKAVGRVACMSALLDEVLGELVDDFIGTDIIWRITTGQSTDWFLQSLKILLNETDPYFTSFTEDEHQVFLELLKQVDELRNIRNRVIHGAWTNKGIMEEDTIPRPWGTTGSETVIHVSRNRNRRGLEGQEMTIEDVNQLADKLIRVREDLVRAYRTMTGIDDSTKFPPLSRWAHDEEPPVGSRES